MKALVYHGPGNKAWEDVPEPVIVHPTDIIVRVETTTICGTDLHILKGDVPAVTDGRILGHEGVGTVTEIGGAVTSVDIGDRGTLVLRLVDTRSGVPDYGHALLPESVVDPEGESA